MAKVFASVDSVTGEFDSSIVQAANGGGGGGGLDAEAVRDTIAAALVGGTNITVTPNDGANTITISQSGGAGLDIEAVRDAVGAALVAGAGIAVTVNDGADTITITAEQTYGTNPSLGRMHAAFALRDTTTVKCLFLGSSTTEGTNASAAQFRYVNRLMGMIAAQFPKTDGSAQGSVVALGSVPSGNGIFGINGGVAATIASNYVDATRLGQINTLEPHVIFHMIGANDYDQNRAVATFKSDVQATIASIDGVTTTPHMHVLIQSYERWDAGGGTPAFALYGQALKQIAQASPATIAYVDLSLPYRNAGMPSTDPYGLIEVDEIHQNDAGHAMMADLLGAELGIYTGVTPPVVSPNAQSGSYTLVATDASKAIEVTSASAATITVPTNSSVAFPIGTIIEVVQLGAGQVTVSGSGVTFQNSQANNRTRAQYSTISIRKRATDTWLIVGDCG